MSLWKRLTRPFTGGPAPEPDPFVAAPELEGPATLSGRQLITFATGLGPGLLLLSVYDTPAGALVVAHATDFGQSLGSPMLNFAPSVGEETRRAVPGAQALVLAWPTDECSSYPVRITFERVDEDLSPAGPVTVVAGPEDASPTVLTRGDFTSRFAGTVYGHTSFEELRQVLGEGVDLELTYAQVDELALAIPGGDELVKSVITRKDEAADGMHALLREHGLE